MAAADWGTFARAQPLLAAAATERLHGRVAYLGTIRKDGSPRVHSVTPIVAEDALYLFMEPTSPKGSDLRRDARFTLHAGVEDVEGGGGELALSGEAVPVLGSAERRRAVLASTYPPAERYILYALTLREALWTVYGDGGPLRTRWAGG